MNLGEPCSVCTSLHERQCPLDSSFMMIMTMTNNDDKKMRIIVAIMMIIMIKIMIKIRVMIIIIMIRQRKIILCIAIVMMRMMVINIMAVPNGFASYHFPALSSLYFPHNFQCINFAAPVMASFVFLLYQCLKFPWQMLYSFTSLIPRFILTSIIVPRRLLCLPSTQYFCLKASRSFPNRKNLYTFSNLALVTI